uniref:Putative secreted protein n=1 Tax=Ixodes ricinus TaxID=34613 RepID=A0A6B0UC90_IXORI
MHPATARVCVSLLLHFCVSYLHKCRHCCGCCESKEQHTGHSHNSLHAVCNSSFSSECFCQVKSYVYICDSGCWNPKM